MVKEEINFLRNDPLTHFRPVFPFHTPWKHQKIIRFLKLSGGIKWEYWLEMSQGISLQVILLNLNKRLYNNNKDTRFGHLYLKVRSTSIATFRNYSAISLHFAWIFNSSKINPIQPRNLENKKILLMLCYQIFSTFLTKLTFENTVSSVAKLVESHES